MARSRYALAGFPGLLIFFAGILLGCSDPLPRLEDYLGTYRIIKIDDKGESLETPTLNNIELTSESYIYRFDRNGDNRFSAEEVLTQPLDFSVDSGNQPWLLLSDGERKISLLPHDYYDVLFREEASGTTLYARKVIPPRDNLNYIKKRERLYGSYEIIKFRENETILNIGASGFITISESEYISGIDRDSDGAIGEEERLVSPYEFHRDDGGESFLLINRDNIPVLAYREDNFDLLLRRIDSLGNDVIMYLKRR